MSNTIYDFWLMVYQNLQKIHPKTPSICDETKSLSYNQQKIVMLTDIIENDESKCAIYFPQAKDKLICFLNQIGRRHKESHAIVDRIETYFKDFHSTNNYNCDDKIIEIDYHTFDTINDINYNYFVVKNIGVINKKGYTIRKFHCIFHLTNAIDESPAAKALTSDITVDDKNDKHSINVHKYYQFIAYHYWFPHWPDHRSPENIDVVLDMCIDLLDSDCKNYFFDDDNDGECVGVDAETTHQNITNGTIPIIHW